jgi:Siphovirus Gp157
MSQAFPPPLPPVRETLDELECQLDLIVEHLESDSPEDRTAAEQVFETLVPQLERKIDSYVALLERKKATRDYRRAESQRIARLAAADERAAQWLTLKLQRFMERRVEQLGERGAKLEGAFCKISLCTNGGKPPVYINEELSPEQFPAEFVESVPALKIDALKEAALSSATGEVRDERGRLLAKAMPRGQHLRVR